MTVKRMRRDMVVLLLAGICAAGCHIISTPMIPFPDESSTPSVTPSEALPSTEPSTPRPGLILRGMVRLEDGRGLADVNIFLALASYGGRIVAVTDANGDFQSDAVYIPGDEMIRVWAEREGFGIVPEESAMDTQEYFWRHYYGLERRVLKFVAHPETG
jgi:hypothetical protein